MRFTVIGPVVAAVIVGLGALPSHAQKAKVPAAVALPQGVFAATARLSYGTISLNAASPNRQPYRDKKDNAICIAPESLAVLGITAQQQGKVVKLQAADGNLVIAEARLAPPERGGTGVFIDAVSVLRSMGAALRYDVATETLTLLSILTEVNVVGDTVRLKAWLPIAPKATSDETGKRWVIDVPCASVQELPKRLEINGELIRVIRTSQVDETTARVIVERNDSQPVRWIEGRTATVATIGPSVSPTVATTEVSPVQPTKVAPLPPSKPVPPTAAPMALRNARFATVNDDLARIFIDTSRRATVRPVLRERRLTLEFGNTTVAQAALTALEGSNHPLIQSVRLVPAGEKAARLILELTQKVSFAIKVNPLGGLVLDVITPRRDDGPLVGKTIVVDPGHGGSDSGATHYGKREKDTTLAVARLLTEELQNRGANVVQTRDSDTFIEVNSRPLIANQVQADFFISVHCDSGAPNYAMNGSTVYYHQFCVENKDLAQFIASRLGQDVGVIRSKGVHADTRFSTGYGVLRNSQMMAVLVETGFLSNTADASQLTSIATRQKIAAAIAQGITDFVSANPERRTQLVNPQPVRENGFPLPDNENDNNSVQ